MIATSLDFQVTRACAEIFSYGHRNPQGIAKHPSNGSIWISEHGPQGGDEINTLKAGRHYGWPRVTYDEEYGGGKMGEGTHQDGLYQSLVHWVPSIGTGGITFYTGDLYPHWGEAFNTRESFGAGALVVHQSDLTGCRVKEVLS